ncbi:MAG: hypothetical protein MJ051_05635 [Akkermansia sp.]|nr:hypothetical protein [Akkermansia sp.]
MVKPNFIPRTLIGVGGVRLFDLPGVVYPKEMLRPARGMNRGNGKPYNKIPEWGIDTAEAAGLLRSSRSSARAVLHRHKVAYRLVSVQGGPPRLYWRRSQVEALAARRVPMVKGCPKRMVDSVTAREMLGIGRSTLYRYVQKKLLHERQVRLVTPKGTRLKAYYLRAEVAKLAARMRAIRARERELQRLLQMRGSLAAETWAEEAESLPSEQAES